MYQYSALSVLCLGVFVVEPASAQFLYFSEFQSGGAGWIKRIRVDGGGRQRLLETSPGIRGLELAADRGLLYWGDVDADTIFRAPLSDPEDFETIVGDVDFAQDIAIDSARDTLVWIDAGSGVISRSRLDGSGVEAVIDDLLCTSLALDPMTGAIYFEDRSDVSRGAIRRIDRDGSNLETIIDDVPTASDLAIDPVNGYVYWGSTAGFDNTGGIYRVRFDGTGLEEIFKPDVARSDATTLTLDLDSRIIYFAVHNTANDADIYRMGLDGSNPTIIATGFELIPHMTFLVPSPAGLRPLAAAGLLASRRRRPMR